jgi:hypothetical protein
MECFGVGWDGIPHSSVADTFACCRVWHKLFPRYYLGEQDASLDVPTFEVHHHDKAGNIIPEEEEVVLNADDLTEATEAVQTTEELPV